MTRQYSNKIKIPLYPKKPKKNYQPNSKKHVIFILLLSIEFFKFAPLHPQEPSFILETDTPEPYTSTYLGNGTFSMVSSQLGTKPTVSYMAFVYDHGAGDVPRIATLPAWNEINFFNGKSWLNEVALDKSTLRSYQQSLDMYNGCITTKYLWVDGEKSTNIEVQAFVSRANPNLAIVKLLLMPHYSGRVNVSFSLHGWDAMQRWELIRLENVRYESPGGWPEVWYPGHMKVKDRNVEMNLGSGCLWMVSQAVGRPTSVSQVAEIAWHPAELKHISHATLAENTIAIEYEFDVSAEGKYIFVKYVAIVSSHQTPNHLESARRVAQQAKARGWDALFKEHTDAWHRLWQTDIVVENNPELQKLLHSMIFYLLCSVGEGTDFSIPPMGLSSAGYYGHIFWDADTWMFPALVVMHPEIAKSMVMFRYRTLEAAMTNARLNGYRGAMYPWESDELGHETTPKFAYQNALYEIHVTGDVALAQWQYYLATDDKEWLAQYGYPVIKETADFWASRVTYNEEKDRYEIRNVVSVDEGLMGINNDAYTNAIAKKNLKIAISATSVLGEDKNPDWEKISSKLYIPYDRQKEYHPTYENAPPATLGSVVPLLSYPLELPMSALAKRNNLENAVKRMTERGQGGMMSITFYPMVAVELGDRKMLNLLFPKSYKPYLRPPFNVLAETGSNNAVNFLTGAGGFLQQVIYGYTGLRLSPDGLTQKFDPLLPRGLKKLILRNFNIKNKRYDIVIENNNIKFVDR